MSMKWMAPAHHSNFPPNLGEDKFARIQKLMSWDQPKVYAGDQQPKTAATAAAATRQ